MPDDTAPRFADLVRELIAAHGGVKQNFARELGVDPPVISRILNGRSYRQPSIDLCMRLARVGGVSFRRVMREAGQEEKAELLCWLCARDQPWAAGAREYMRVSDDERQILEWWRSADDESTRALRVMLKNAARGAADHPSPQRRRRRP